MKRWTTILLLCLSFGYAEAQQDPLFSQYMFNRLILNPAYAGSREQLSLVGIWRQQWVDWDGAPQTQSVGIHAPTPDQRHGFGLHFVNDRVGYTSNTLGSFSYAYRIPVGEGHLALGLTAGMNSYWVRVSQVKTWQQGDVSFGNGGDFGRWIFMAGPGVYFQNDLWYGGLSMPNVFANRLYDPYYAQLFAHKSRHLYATGGMLLRLSSFLQFRPSVLLRVAAGAPVGADLSAALFLKEKLLVGLSYRPGNAWVGMLEIYLTPQMRIGYAYDHTVSALQGYQSGSHEFMLGIDFGFSRTRMVSPKLF